MTEDPDSPLAVRRDRFLGTLGQNRQMIVERWSQLRHGAWSRPTVDALRSSVRELSEHSAEYGFGTLGEVARELLNRVKALVGDRPPTREQIGWVTASVEQLNMQVDRTVQAAAGTPAPRPAEADGKRAHGHSVVLALADPELAALVTTLLRSEGLEPTAVADSAALKQRLAAPGTAALVIDQTTLQPFLDAPQATRERASWFGETPWILLAERPLLRYRLRVAGSGAIRCLDAPPDFGELEAALRLACMPLARAAWPVRVIAASHEQTERHVAQLRAEGLEALPASAESLLSDPPEGHRPEALLLDFSADRDARDRWLEALAESSDLDQLPVVCLLAQRAATTHRHRRCVFVQVPVTARSLALTLHRTILEHRIDAQRAARWAQIRANPRLRTAASFESALDAALPSSATAQGVRALVRVELADAPRLLRSGGSQAPAQALSRIEAPLMVLLGGDACCARLGSLGLVALSDTFDRDAIDALQPRLQQALEGLATHTPTVSVLMPVESGPFTAEALLAQTRAALREAHAGTAERHRLLQAVAPAPVAATAVASTREDAATPEPPGGLPTGQMQLAVHPLIDFAGREQNLLDAAIRCLDTTGNEVSSAALFAEVVSKGLATELDEWEIRAVGAYLHALPQGSQGVEVAMRLSAASRSNPTLLPLVEQVVAELPKGAGRRLVFEVQESWLVEHSAVAVELAQALRKLGCGIMLGDFGSSDNPRNIGWAGWFDYARLSRVRMQAFIHGGGEDPALEKLVRTATAQGARIVAGRTAPMRLRMVLADWGVTLFEPTAP